MARNCTIIFTDRDREILAALARTPLTALQLLTISQTFTQPLTADRPLRRRMQLLASAGWVKSYRYASGGSGAVKYYKLTPTGFRLLNGPKAVLPSRGSFRPVSLGLQQHTRSLADFIVHTTVAAHRAGTPITGFHRENELQLTIGHERMQPDCAFQLKIGSQHFNYLVELDNGTEPVYSRKERDSLARKIAFYDRYQTASRHRFRVLTVMTKAGARLDHYLAAARELVSNPQRRLFYGIHLNDYLTHPDPLLVPLFLDHEQQRQPLIPARVVVPITKR